MTTKQLESYNISAVDDDYLHTLLQQFDGDADTTASPIYKDVMLNQQRRNAISGSDAESAEALNMAMVLED